MTKKGLTESVLRSILNSSKVLSMTPTQFLSSDDSPRFANSGTFEFWAETGFPAKTELFSSGKNGIVEITEGGGGGGAQGGRETEAGGGGGGPQGLRTEKINSQSLRTFFICVKFDWKELKYNPLAEIFMMKEIKQLICHLPDPWPGFSVPFWLNLYEAGTEICGGVGEEAIWCSEESEAVFFSDSNFEDPFAVAGICWSCGCWEGGGSWKRLCAALPLLCFFRLTEKKILFDDDTNFFFHIASLKQNQDNQKLRNLINYSQITCVSIVINKKICRF